MGVCSKCDKSVEVEDGCVVGNLTYHRRCFACAGCKRAIKPSEYMIQDGENICFDCYNRNEIKTCTKCGDLIQGEWRLPRNSFITIKLFGESLACG